MDANAAVPLVRSFERNLRAANCAPTTVTNYLHAVRQAHRFLHAAAPPWRPPAGPTWRRSWPTCSRAGSPQPPRPTTRSLPFGRTAGEALDRYRRARARHRHAELPWLWLGQQDRLTDSGLVMMLRRRGRQAGLPKLHPTSSATPSPTSGSPRAAARPT